MPQLMPFMWIFSSFIIICLIVVVCFLYDSMFLSKYLWEKSSDDMVKINWKW